MRFATFNLYQFLAPPDYWYERTPRNRYSEQAWQAKRRWIISQLNTLDADIVGFQEVFSAEDLQALAKKAGYPHFAVSGESERRAEDEQVHTAPKLAIASRVPLTEVSVITPDETGLQQLGVDSDFCFRRSPLTAMVQMPGVGAVRLVVVHLKSKRSAVEEITYKKRQTWVQRVADTMQRQSIGQISSLRQRGAEASLLYRCVADHLLNQPDVPNIVMGDLNDSAESIVFESLVMQNRITRVGADTSEKWPKGLAATFNRFRLNDSFRQAPDYQTRVRPHTYVRSGTPDAIDHILLSDHFKRNSATAVGEVMAFEVFNEHLAVDGEGQERQSDHGQVVVEVLAKEKLATDRLAECADSGTPSQKNESDIVSGVSREEFIAQAGGVFESDQSWRQWNGAAKFDNYWSFYFDKEYGWVKSVYGQIPVSELHQRQRYSIEHIIPRSFIKRYMKSRNRPGNVRYGASVNPLNFAAAERGINSSRSSFPFDMDGDVVLRPFRIDLNPDAYGMTGLDADNEWVIPSISRGDIARSILYMVMVYGIDELYNRHLDTLVHWAKVDPATPWELAFNAWVYGRLGIRNPFVDEPTVANRYLDDRGLLASVLVGEDGRTKR